MCGAPSNTTTTQLPAPEQRAALKRVMDLSEQRFDQGPRQYFPGQTLAGQDPSILAAQQSALGALGGQQQLGEAGATAISQALDPTSAQSQAVIKPFIDKLQGQILPGIGSRAMQQGAFGGSRQAIQEQQAAEGIAGAATQAMQRNQLAAMSQLAGAQRGLLAPSMTLDAIGRQRQARRQAEIGDAIQRFNFGQAAEDNALDRLASRITGVNLGQIGETTGSGGGMDAANAAGLALAGYGLFS